MSNYDDILSLIERYRKKYASDRNKNDLSFEMERMLKHLQDIENEIRNLGENIEKTNWNRLEWLTEAFYLYAWLLVYRLSKTQDFSKINDACIGISRTRNKLLMHPISNRIYVGTGYSKDCGPQIGGSGWEDEMAEKHMCRGLYIDAAEMCQALNGYLKNLI